MSFLAPLFLFGLLAAAIPLAIHLIRREHPPKVAFSSLRFMKQTTRKLVLFQQIQQWLLLLLRAALIVLLVLAFARPLIHSTPLAGLLDGEPESVVVLLDTSLGMQHDERFSRMQQAARDQINSLSAGDEVALISFDSAARQRSELSSDRTGALAAVSALETPGFDRARFFPALQLAEESLRTASHSNQRVVMISAFQANAIDGLDAGWNLPPGVRFEGIDVAGSGVRNVSLSDVRAPAQLLEGVSDYEILARLRSTGTVNVDRADVELWLNDALVHQQQVELDRSAEAVVSLPLSLDEAGLHRGQIRLAGDDFEADNHYYFTIDVHPRVRVLIVNGAPSENWFEDAAHWVSLALSGDGSTPYSAEVIEPATLDSIMLTQQDVVMVLNSADFDAAQSSALQRFVNDGGHLVLAPGAAVDAARFNAAFSDLTQVELLQPQRLPENDYLLIADVDRRHPVLAPLDIDWSTRFQGYWQLTDELDEDRVLMRFDNAAPALLEAVYGEGRLLMLTTPLDLSWSNLPLQGIFLPFIHESLNYLVQSDVPRAAWQVGEMLTLELASDAELLTPTGDSMALSAPRGSWRAEVPGFYRLAGADDGDQVLAVNIAPAASEMARIAVSALHDRIVNPDTTPQQSAAVRTAQLMVDIEQPQRLWWWILLLVLCLLLVETAVANRTHR